jgi:transcriptional regulator
VLIHPWDAAVDEAEWRQVVASYPFGVLSTAGVVDGWPVAVPTQFTVAAADRLVLHLARPNPVWRALEVDDRVLLTVATDWAYIPSDWKTVGAEDPRLGIPTTYYSAVIFAARAEVLDGQDDKAAVLRRQLADVQPGVEVADPLEHGRTLAGIRAVVLRVDHVRAKLKYGGNVDDEHRAKVAAGLQRRGGPGDQAALSHMRARHRYDGEPG